MPKIHSIGKNLLCGIQFSIPQNRNLQHLVIPEDVISILKKVNQNINFKAQFGAGLRDF